jgi:hypothetical protein
LEKDFKYFYVQYNDPIYVKLEKIDILYKLTDLKNFEAIIGELKNYAITEFDIDFVKKAIRYIGNIGFKFDKSVDICVEAVKEILDHNQDFAVCEAIIIARDLMRKYKGKTLDLLKKITGELSRDITEPEAKAAFLYIIGEFCNNIPKSTELITPYITNFADESPVVKLQILNAIIKNYVNKPDDESESLVKSALKMGGEETENPDVRDRAYVYWRLLESEPDVAKEMIMAEKPAFEFREDIAFEGTIVDNIIENMTNISAVYQKFSNELIPKEDMVIDKSEEEEKESKTKEEAKGEEKPKKESKKQEKIINTNINQNDVDLIGLGEDNHQPQQQNQGANTGAIANNIFEIFGTGPTTNTQQGAFNNNIFGVGVDSNQGNLAEFEFVEDQNIVIFDENQGVTLNKPTLNIHNTTQGNNGKSGLVIYSTFHKIKEDIFFGMYIKNLTNTVLNEFALSFKLNSFGIVPLDKIDGLVVYPGKHEIVKIKCSIDNEKFDKKPPSCPFSIDVAVTTSLDVFIFNVPFLVNSLFSTGGRMKKEVFIEFMKNPNTTNTVFSLKPTIVNSTDSLKQLLERNNIFLVAQVNKGDNSMIYYSTMINNISNVIEITYPKNGNLLGFKVVSTVNPLIPLVKEVLEFILK